MSRFPYLAILAAFWTSCSPAIAQPRPPQDIVVIQVDDLDVGLLQTLLDHGLAGNIERYFVNGGVTFRNSFVATALCAPSRASVLTGQYAHNHGVLDNLSCYTERFDESESVAHWLQDAKYNTAHVGKYLTWPEAEVRPPCWTEYHGLVGQTAYYNYRIRRNDTVVQYGARPEDYQTHVLTDIAEEVIERLGEDDDPFFLVVAPSAAHVGLKGENLVAEAALELYCLLVQGRLFHLGCPPAPLDVGKSRGIPFVPDPSFNEPSVSDKPSDFQRLWPLLRAVDIADAEAMWRSRLESMIAVDEMVGRVFSALEKAHRLERTVVFFTSDNGHFHGEHRLSQKNYPYEEAIRVPLYAHLPGSGVRTEDRLVVNVDLAPTFLELAGLPPRDSMDGRSLLPLLRGEDPGSWRKRFLVELRGSSMSWEFSAVRTGNSDASTPERLYAEWREEDRVPPSVTAEKGMVQEMAELLLVDPDCTELLSAYDLLGYRPDVVSEAWDAQFANLRPVETEYYDLRVDPFQMRSAHARPATFLPRQRLARYLDGLRDAAGAEIRRWEEE